MDGIAGIMDGIAGIVQDGETQDGTWVGGGIIGVEIFGTFPMDGEDGMILFGTPFWDPLGDGIIGDGEEVSIEMLGVHLMADFIIDLST